MIPAAETSDRPAAPNISHAIRITLLGPVAVEIDGQHVDLGRPQNALLLARLALSAPSPVSVDSLIDALWGERPPPSARKNLQKCVSELRRYLGVDAIRTERFGYLLDVPPDNIDLHAFDRTVAEARAARALNDLDTAWELFGRAHDMWGDRALDGLGEVGFVADEAMRLDEVRIAALEELVEVGLALGKHSALIPTLQDLVHRYPLREALWSALMLALYRAGRQADALAAYRTLREILDEELGVEPSPEIRNLEQRILLQDPGLTEKRGTTGVRNAPRRYTSFVGREPELAAMKARLVDSRLVTVTGPGGAGKTRLAVEVATSMSASYRDGAWFVDLASLAEESELVAAMGGAFGLSEEPDISMLDTLLAFLAGAQLLLIMDNCEHLTSGVAAFVSSTLGATSSVTILATSREPLALTGERLFPLGPMSIPAADEEDPDRIEQVDSVRLFVERAAAADPAFRWTAAIAPTIAAICRGLDGIPLAIELAARQLSAVGPEELLRGLLDHLARGAPGESDERHRTMEAAIGWSFNRLSDEQRDLFVTLSAIAGSFPCEAVQHITGTAHRTTMTLALSDLVDRSMLTRTDDGGTARYRLLEPIRDYATRQAERLGLSHSLRRAHCEWVLALFESCTPLRGPREREYLKRLSVEHHHLLAALDWAVAHDPELALRLLVAAVPYTQMVVYRFRWAETASLAIAQRSDIDRHLRAAAMARGSEALAENFEHEKVRPWAAAAVELADEIGDQSLAGYALVGLGWSYRSIGALDSAEQHLRAAIDRFEQAGDLIGLGHARHSLSFVLMAQDRYEDTLRTSMDGLEIWLRLGSDWGAGRAWWHVAAAHARAGAYAEAHDAVTRALKYFEGFDDLGSVTHVRAVEGDIARLAGNFDRARDVYLACLRGFQDVGDRRCVASTLRNLGIVALHHGSDDEALTLLQASLRQRYELEDVAGVTECGEGLGLVAHHAGRSESAAVMLGAADRLRRETSARPTTSEQEEIETTTQELRSALGETLFAELWNRGRGLSLERMIEEAESLTVER